jgi:hypothetical protein
MQQHDEPVTLSLAGIARLARVGRAAVSNWRRRHTAFPDPVGGTDASPKASDWDSQRYRLPGAWFAAKVPARETRYAGVEFWGGQALHRVV